MVCEWNVYNNNNEGESVDQRKKVTVVGGGNWGSAIACVVGNTVRRHVDEFCPTVTMWCRDSRKPDDTSESLADTINRTHENSKYLPGRKLPRNVVATSDLVKACQDAHFLILVCPHQGIKDICQKLKGKLLPEAQAVSLIKGVSTDKEAGDLKLISDEIQEYLNIDCSVLMGANLAGEVADEKFCEATIGCRNIKKNGSILKKLFNTENFRINVVKDAHTVELNGALKNVVACAAGFADGLGWAYNIKSAVIRLGLFETRKFVEHFYPGSKIAPFFESCGVADLITTCYGGRNRKVCEAFVKSDKTLPEVEKELLNGQSAQGPPTADEVFQIVNKAGITDRFPLFTIVHKICIGEIPAERLMDCLKSHPAHA